MMYKLTLLLVGLCCAFAGIAQPVVNLQPAALSGSVGDQLTVALVVSDFTTIVSYQHSINWNEDALELTAVDNVTPDMPGLASMIDINQANEGIAKISWFDPSNDLAGVTLPDGDTVFTLTYNVLTTTGTDVAITGNPLAIEISQDGTTNAGINTMPAAINGGGPPNNDNTGGGGNGGGNSNDPVTFTVGDAAGAVGDQICLPVSVDNFTDIGGVGFTFTFDPALMQFDQAQNIALAGVTTGNFNAPASQPGNIIFSWNNNAAQTLADGTVLYELCFTLLAEGNGSGTVSITDALTPIEIIDGNNQQLTDVALNSATVMITGGGGGNGGGTGGSTDLTLTVGTASGDSGTQVCVPITTQNFTTIAGLGFTVNFDPALLQFDSIRAINLAGVSQSSINAPASQPGRLIFTWDNNTAQTLAADASLFELCFSLLGGGGTQSSISITGDLTPIEAINDNLQAVPVIVIAGQITIMTGVVQSDELQFNIANADIAIGTNGCVAVTANNFNGLVSAQFTIEYDQTRFAFTGPSDINLPDLAPGNFNAPPSLPGKIIFSWNTSAPTTRADGEVLFTLCFDAIGNVGDQSPISITGNPAAIEVFDDAGNQIDPVLTMPGTVTIVDGAITPDPVVLTVGTRNVDAGDNVCVPVVVSDFTNITALQFTIDYDPAGLTFTSPQGFGIAGLSAADVTTPAAGTITVNFNSTPTTVADGTVLLELCFDATGNAGTTEQVTVAAGATASNDAATVGVVTMNGQVTINTDNTLPTGDVLFVLPAQTAESGTQVCFPLTVYDFTNILTFQYSLCYDDTELDFTGAQNFNLPDFVANNVSENTSGNIGVFWFSDSNLNDGATVPDQTVIVELCFDVLAPNGSSATVEFCDTPTSQEVADNNSQTLNAGFGDGTVVIEASSNCAAVGVTGTVTAIDCNGASTGAITASATGGDGTFNYSWSTGATGATINMLAAGTYTVTVTSCGGAGTSTETFTVNESAALVISSAQVTNLNCNDDGSGTIDIEITGGSPGYTYNWSNNAPVDDSQDQTDLPAGNYSVVITDTKGCSITSPTYTVTEPPALAATATTTADPSGCGTADGSITINATGGTDPLQFSIDNGTAFQNSATFTGLTSGTYTTVVRDANGCTLPAGEVILNGSGTPPTIIVNEMTPADPFTSNGAIDLLIINGSGNYSFQWSPGGFTTEDISGLAGGEYTVTVTDNVSQCTAMLTMLVPTTIQVSGTVINTCADTNNGAIDITVAGGNSNNSFQYSWAPAGVGTQSADGDLTDLPAGTYTLTVSDGTNLVPDATATFTVEALPAPVISAAAITNVTGAATNANGCIELTVSGGAAPLVIQWSNGATTVDNCDIPTGFYTVTITDNNGCVTTAGPYEVAYDQDDLESGPVTTSVVPCTNTTEVCFTIEGGVAPYSVTTIASNNISITESVATAGTYCTTVLAGDSYTFVINDAENQSMTFTVVVDPNPGLTTFTTSITPANAMGGNGAIDLTVTSDDGPFTFSWSNGATTEDLSGLDPGCYTVTITNVAGCTVSSEDQCVEVLTISSAVVTNNPCPNNLIGAVDITVAGATTPTFEWTNVGTGAVVSTNEDLSGQPAGTYAVVITDASGQTAGPFTYVIEVESDIDVAIAVESDFNGATISCAGEADGSLRVSASGGVAPYDYLWSTGATTEVVSELMAGEYFVTVQDANDCSMTTSIVIDDPVAIQLTGSATATSCADDVDGSATVMATGGTGNFTYEWDTEAGAQTGATATELSAGSYGVTATDANGCTAETTVTVDEPTAINIVVTVAPDTGDKTGSATVAASGGTAPYAYSYDFDAGAGGAIVDGLTAGEYNVTVTDANGCTATQAFRIDEEGDCLVTRPVITPNADGLNENFVIGCVQQYETATLQIFNRWGQEVFSMPNYDNSWVGQTNRGSLLPEGVYFFVLDYRPVGGTNQQLRGSVTLLRE